MRSADFTTVWSGAAWRSTGVGAALTGRQGRGEGDGAARIASDMGAQREEDGEEEGVDKRGPPVDERERRGAGKGSGLRNWANGGGKGVGRERKGAQKAKGELKCISNLQKIPQIERLFRK